MRQRAVCALYKKIIYSKPTHAKLYMFYEVELYIYVYAQHLITELDVA